MTDPLTLVVLNQRGCARVLEGKLGMTFLVDKFTPTVDNPEQRVAHVRDYRYPDHGSGRNYATWSLAPEDYTVLLAVEEGAAFHYGPAFALEEVRR